MRDKELNRCFFVFDSIPDQYKTQVIYVSLFLYILFNSLSYKSQKKYDEAVDDCLAVLKFIPDWFVTNKII